MEVVPGSHRVWPREDFEEERSFLNAEPRTVRVEAGGECRGVDFVLLPCGAIDGTVQRQDGGTLESLHVYARGLRPGSGDGSIYNTDRFHFPLAGGRYKVEATGNAGGVVFTLPEPVLVELPDGAVRTVRLQLVPSTVVFVNLVRAEEPGTFAVLEALDERGCSYGASRLEPGNRFELLLQPGPYTLRASHEGRLFERELSVATGERKLEVEFRLE